MGNAWVLCLLSKNSSSGVVNRAAGIDYPVLCFLKKRGS